MWNGDREETMTRKAVLWTTFLVLTMAMLVACGGGGDPQAVFCENLAQVNETASAVATLDNAADIAQMVQLGAAIENDWKNVTSSAERLDNTALQASVAVYNDQFDDIPSVTQETLPAVARQTLDTMASVAQSAYNELYGPNCQ